MRIRYAVYAAAMLLVAAAFFFTRPTYAAAPLPSPKVDIAASQQKDAAPRTAVFAAGCFWCVEGAFERIDGVIDVVSGYAGGTKDTADYELVSAGKTGHAEAVEVTYDPSKVSYGQLLRVLFTIHDPTTKDRQGPDWGHQYRSAIFYANDDEKRVAAAYVRQLDEAKLYASPIVTTLEPLAASGFYRAEAYHQDYVRNHPDHPYVRAWFPAKLEKLRTQLSDRLKPELRGSRAH